MKWRIVVLELVVNLALLVGLLGLGACVARWDVGAGSAEVCKLSELSCTSSRPAQPAPVQ